MRCDHDMSFVLYQDETPICREAARPSTTFYTCPVAPECKWLYAATDQVLVPCFGENVVADGDDELCVMFHGVALVSSTGGKIIEKERYVGCSFMTVRPRN